MKRKMKIKKGCESNFTACVWSLMSRDGSQRLSSSYFYTLQFIGAPHDDKVHEHMARCAHTRNVGGNNLFYQLTTWNSPLLWWMNDRMIFPTLSFTVAIVHVFVTFVLPPLDQAFPHLLAQHIHTPMILLVFECLFTTFRTITPINIVLRHGPQFHSSCCRRQQAVLWAEKEKWLLLNSDDRLCAQLPNKHMMTTNPHARIYI